jgi:hypothetical protein
MNERDRAGDAPWRDALLLAAAALAVRVAAAHGREIWYDDVYRVRDALLPWGGVWTDLPWLDNQKSPWLVALHKLYVLVAGTASPLAIRGFGIATGTLLVVLAWDLARVAGGRWCAVAVGAFYALDPFFVRWSVEVHNYTPAALAAGALWSLVLRRDALTLRGAALCAGLAGFAVAMFPPAALAVAPVLVTRPFRRLAPGDWALAAAVAGAIVAPAAVSILRSREFLAAALAAGPGPRLRLYHYNRVRTPSEVLARMGGLDLRQGSGTFAMGLCAAAVVGAVLARRVLARGEPPSPSRAARDRLLLAGMVPLALALLASAPSRPFVYDRYAAALLAFLPCVVIVGLWPDGTPPSGAARRASIALGAAGGLALLGTLVAGGVRAIELGAEFPREVTSRAYRGVALVDEALAAHPAPATIAVHGEGLCLATWIRTAAPETVRPRLALLTSREWARAEQDGDRSAVAIEPAYGWPFGVAHLAGRDVAVDRDDVRGALERGAAVWIVIEDTLPEPTWYLAEEEEREGVREVRDLAARPPDAARDAAILRAIRGYLGLPADFAAAVDSRPPAVLVRLGSP